MFGLSAMALAIGAAGILAVLVGGGWWSYDAGKTAQREADRPVIEKLTGDRALAQAANANLRTEFDKIETETKACSAKVEALGKPTATARSELAAVKIAADQRVKLLETRLTEMQRRAASVSNLKPEMKCEAAREVLGELSDHMRNILGIATPKPSSDTVRIN